MFGKIKRLSGYGRFACGQINTGFCQRRSKRIWFWRCRALFLDGRSLLLYRRSALACFCNDTVNFINEKIAGAFIRPLRTAGLECNGRPWLFASRFTYRIVCLFEDRVIIIRHPVGFNVLDKSIQLPV